MRFQDIVMAAGTQAGGAAAAPPVSQFVNGGDFSTAAPWTLSAVSATIAAGLLNFVSAAGTRRCYQPSLGTYVLGKVYRITGVGSLYVADNLVIRIGADINGNSGTARSIFAGDPEWPVGNGPFSVDITLATLTGQNHTIGASTGAQFSADNFSIVELP